jgi:hypothetical protein
MRTLEGVLAAVNRPLARVPQKVLAGA